MRTFAKNLKRERLYKELTQQQMAELLKISYKTYQSYEALGKAAGRTPDLELIVQMAGGLASRRAAGIKPDKLLGK